MVVLCSVAVDVVNSATGEVLEPAAVVTSEVVAVATAGAQFAERCVAPDTKVGPPLPNAMHHDALLSNSQHSVPSVRLQK